jgi:YhcH/YjgK/YiaL family protein
VRQALEYLRTHDMSAVPVGRHEIDGDRLVALVQEYTTRPMDECAWEAHRKYIDVQFVVRGSERMGHAPRSSLVPRQAYDVDRDVSLFEPGAAFVTIGPGSYAIFGPEDVHAPGGAVTEPEVVRKVVVKAIIEPK